MSGQRKWVRERDLTKKALASANDLCRSAMSIAQRDGAETAWDAFRVRLSKSLELQHLAMYGPLQFGASAVREQQACRLPGDVTVGPMCTVDGLAEFMQHARSGDVFQICDVGPGDTITINKGPSPENVTISIGDVGMPSSHFNEEEEFPEPPQPVAYPPSAAESSDKDLLLELLQEELGKNRLHMVMVLAKALAAD